MFTSGVGSPYKRLEFEAQRIHEKYRDIILDEGVRQQLVRIMNGYFKQGNTWPQIERIMWNLAQDSYETRIKKYLGQGKGPLESQSLAEREMAIIIGWLLFVPFHEMGNQPMIEV